MRKKQVIDAFGQADQYASHAHLHRPVADQLAHILPPLVHPTILELGCGTGFLSQHLRHRWPESPFLCSDIALPMVQRCRSHLGNQNPPLYAVLDGEQPPLPPDNIDLMAASMVFQWFGDPSGSLARLHGLLRPGGCLAFATLGPGTFREWQTAASALRMESGLPAYPTAEAWQRAWPTPGQAPLREEVITVHHPSGLAFLRTLRAIGAHQPAPGYHPQSAGQMRRLLRHWENGEGLAVSYAVLYGVFFRDSLAPSMKIS